MKLRRTTYLVPLALALLIAAGTLGWRYYGSRATRDIPLTTERELKVNIEAGFSDVTISRGRNSAGVCNIVVDTDEKINLDDCINYRVRDDVGYLDISTDCTVEEERRKKGKNVHVSDLNSQEWDLQFNDDLPIAFDAELGLGRADIDLTGLMVKSFNLSTGASSVSLRCSTPNKYVIHDINIEAGLSKFRAEGLGNLNFRHLRFEGGVGTYVLDFTGSLDTEVDVDIEVGLGSLTIIVPREIGAKIMYNESWIAHLTIDRNFSEDEENAYFSTNYETAKGKMNMRIEAGLGTVKVRQE